MNRNIRLTQLEKEASLDIRTSEALPTNPEYLKLSIESFLEKYQGLMLEDKFEAQQKLNELCLDPNFKLMYTLYRCYFDISGKEREYSTDLCKLANIKKLNQLEQAFCDDTGGTNCEGLISPEGIYYPAVKSHYCLCAWLNLKGIDIRGYVRTFFGSKARILFSDLTDYVYMEKNTDFALTEQQVKSLQALFRINTKDSRYASFHNAVEESYRYGFCRFSDAEKTRKQIELFEDVLGKKEVDSREILSTKIKYY